MPLRECLYLIVRGRQLACNPRLQPCLEMSTYVKLGVTTFMAAVLWAHNGFDLPMAALPSFGFIFLVYGVLILWELRVLLPPLRVQLHRLSPGPAYHHSHLYTVAHRTHTRSSTA
jgi:hypothetical protein